MLVMRAALNEHGLFCLAFAEVLNYEESDQIFQFLQQLMKESKQFIQKTNITQLLFFLF